MTIVAELREAIVAWLPVLAALVIGIAFLVGIRRYLDYRSGGTFTLGGQVVMLVLTASAIMGVILALPLGDAARGQLLSLLGIILTAAVALSSTTFIGNAMAGMMLRAVRSFEPGDFVRVGDHFGRVSDQGLLHTEIQTEDRDLTTIPNLHLVTRPVTVIRSSGTVLSANVSLGYDVPRTDVEFCLLEAARNAELKDPFVQLLELTDYSVVYRIAGFLEDVKFSLSARSQLRCCMLDALHSHGIEIVSPSFMNQRVLSTKTRIVPAESHRQEIRRVVQATPPEMRIFDKAEEAEALAALEKEVDVTTQQITVLKDKLANTGEPESSALQKAIDQRKEHLNQLQSKLEVAKDGNAASGIDLFP